MDITKLLAAAEGKTIEFKRDISSLKQILKTIVAFANTSGGTILVGRGDNDEIIGLPDALQAGESLASSISDSVSPLLPPEIEIVTVEGKSLLLIRVFHWHGPFFLNSEGSENGVYIRLGSTNRKVGPEILAELRRVSQNKTFDQVPCPDLTGEALDFAKIQKVFDFAGRKIDESKLVSLGILVPYAGKNVVSQGGLILFGTDKFREQYFPDARVSCARFRGTDKAEFVDRLDIDGSVLNALDDVAKFIKRNTRLLPKIVSFKRQDIPAYPEIAVREVLVNAVWSE